MPINSNNMDKLYFGKDDAERDFAGSGLLKAGFLRTSMYEAAKDGTKSLIIGRKGSGKSAIALMLHKALCDESDIYSSVITPDAISADEIKRFELTGINDEQAKKLVWRYVFLVQISKFLVEHTRSISPDENTWPAGIRTIRQFLVENGEVDDLTFQEKFWRIISRLKTSITLKAFNQQIDVKNEAPSEGIRLGTKLEFLETYLKEQLAHCPSKKLYLLVDKVDEIWTNDSWSDLMVVGLLMASKEINESFLNVNCIVCLRTDIYEMLIFHDRDKFRGDEAHISWSDDKLSELIVARGNASTNKEFSSRDFWNNYFPPALDDVPISTFLLERTLKRPRDVIQLCNLCADNSRINSHLSITEKDVRDALETYSTWKLSDLLAEYKINYPFLNDLLVLFSNTSYILKRKRFVERFSLVQSALSDRYRDIKSFIAPEPVLNILYSVGFIGVERNGRTVYYYQDARTIENLDETFVIHPAFRNALKCVSSLDLEPFTRGDDLEDGHDEGFSDYGASKGMDIQRGRSANQAHLESVRGSSNVFEELQFRLSNVADAVRRENMPTDIQREISSNLKDIISEVERRQYDDDPVRAGITLSKISKYLTNLSRRLNQSEFFAIAAVIDDELERIQRATLSNRQFF